MSSWKLLNNIMTNTEDSEFFQNQPKTESERGTKDSEEKKQNRKIDVSLWVSGVALLISLLQFIFSTPFYLDYYNKSSFEVTEGEPSVRGEIFTTSYFIKNTSKNTVNNIELVFQLLRSDTLQIIAGLATKIVCKENGPVLKNCFISIDKLVPNENLGIIIDSELDSIIRYNTSFFSNAEMIRNELEDSLPVKMSDWKLEHLAFPSITLAKFDKGFGKITQQPIKETLMKLEKLKQERVRK